MRSFALFFAAGVLVASCQATVSQCWTGMSATGSSWTTGGSVAACSAPNNAACAITKVCSASNVCYYSAECSPLGGGNSATGCQATSAGVTRVGKTSSSDAWNGKTAAQVKTEVDA